MNQSLISMCDLMAENRKILSKLFPMSSGLMLLAGAELLSESGRQADPEKTKECLALLKATVGPFSNFRGNIKIPVVCRMTLADDPSAYLERLTECYELFKQHKPSGGEYKCLAALVVCEHVPPADYEAMVQKTKDIFDGMKDNHRFLTSDEDIPFAAMLAVSGFDIRQLLCEMEADYRKMKEHFHDSNAVQSLSHVLALSPLSTEIKADKIFRLFDTLKQSKHKFGTGLELAALGSFVFVEETAEALAQRIAEADDYLKSKKGFGAFSLSANERRLFSAQLVAKDCFSDRRYSDQVLLSSALTLTIASQAVMMICMTSAAVTHTAVHSSS